MLRFLNIFTYETQVCMVLILVLAIILISGMIGYRMGIDRTMDYLERINLIKGGE